MFCRSAALLFVLANVLLIGGCDQKPKPTETKYFHIWIHDEKKDGDMYLGKAKGLSSCRYYAKRVLRANKMSADNYKCCLITSNSQCAEEDK